MQPFFITGIGTGVGKTLVSAIVTEALGADYWKPVQAGLEDGTDTGTIQQLVHNPLCKIYPEAYRLQTPASPHIAARMDGVQIETAVITAALQTIQTTNGHKPLVIEGAGGLLVPLSASILIADLIKELNARVILVSRNYLGSINHSLLTAAYCKTHNIDVAGWIFTDDFLQYEAEIVQWSGYPSLGSIPRLSMVNQLSIQEQALRLRNELVAKLNIT